MARRHVHGVTALVRRQDRIVWLRSFVERWLIGRLRDRRFYSLAELNAAIGELLKRLNEERPIRRLGVTRRQLFEELDQPALKPLPVEPYVFAEWRVRRLINARLHALKTVPPPTSP